jgi:hypothetical protein
MSRSTVKQIPADNAAFPKTLLPLVGEWRAAADRARSLQADIRKAQDDVVAARVKDADELRSAVLEGSTPPPIKAHEGPADQRLADLRRALRVAESERDRVGRLVAVELHGDDARAHFADYVESEVRPALDAYADELAEAQARIESARARLDSAARLIGFVTTIDAGADVEPRLVRVDGPNWTAATATAAEVGARLDAIGERGRPRMRTVRISVPGEAEGRRLTVTREMAAEFLRDGRVLAWEDGYAAEAPAPAPGTSGPKVRR